MVDVVIAWELMHPALTGAIIGIRSEKEAREMKDGTGLVLSRDEMQEIERATA
jgi:aryl-alcohol dehydrogenase-like predicted oxidoreductase